MTNSDPNRAPLTAAQARAAFNVQRQRATQLVSSRRLAAQRHAVGITSAHPQISHEHPVLSVLQLRSRSAR